MQPCRRQLTSEDRGVKEQYRKTILLYYMIVYIHLYLP